MEDSQEITHLQYADDALVLCEAGEEQILMLRVIFISFQAVSGLHITGERVSYAPLMK